MTEETDMGTVGDGDMLTRDRRPDHRPGQRVLRAGQIAPQTSPGRMYVRLPHTGTAGGIMSSTRADARINVRLPNELKQTIEEAAAALGQSVSDFAVSTIVREARQILQEARVTRLSNRDRDRFLAALDAADARPNAALKAAARRYRQRHA